MTSINFAGQSFTLCTDGALYWPDENMVIVSDLHFEKSSHYAMKGVFLPPHDTAATLDKLHALCLRFRPDTILFLGDVFHDKTSLIRMNARDKHAFNTILTPRTVIWVEGNHDTGHAPDGVHIYADYRIGNIVFRHIARNTGTKPHEYEISGHYHPGVHFTHKGQKARRPCFMIGAYKMILPAYGTLTGGLNITDPVYETVFDTPYDVFALGHRGVHHIRRDHWV